MNLIKLEIKIKSAEFYKVHKVSPMTIIETKKRTTYKAVSWRAVAILNSWIVLSLSLTDSNLLNAIYMNITGFIVFYVFERIWSKINYGRYNEE